MVYNCSFYIYIECDASCTDCLEGTANNCTSCPGSEIICPYLSGGLFGSCVGNCNLCQTDGINTFEDTSPIICRGKLIFFIRLNKSLTHLLHNF